MENGKIAVKAMCLIEHEGKFLVSKGVDRVKNEDFYRVLGGHLDFGERAEAGVRREIREELGCELEKLKFLTVMENVFVYNGNPGHEVTFLYSGELSDKSLYEKKSITITESYGTIEAVWVSKKDILEGETPLYPSFDYKTVLK